MLTRITLAAVALVVCTHVPVAAQNKPDPKKSGGADTARVHLGPATGGTDAFVAYPPGKGTGPAVLVVHEWWGLNAQIRSMARRLAQQGYTAIVPDLYHGKVAGDPEQAHVLVRGVDQARAQTELGLAIQWLRQEPRVGDGKIGVIGFCMGGSLALEQAIRNREVSAIVTYYGRPESDATKFAALTAPVQGHFGSKDDGIPVAAVESFRLALTKAGKANEIFLYPNAGHAFMYEGRPSYSHDAAALAWPRTLAFFQKHLKN